MTFTSEISDTLSVAEAAAILGCHPNTVRVRLQKEQLPGRKINTNTGPQWRVFRSGPFADVPTQLEPNLDQTCALAQVSGQADPLVNPGYNIAPERQSEPSAATLPQLPQPGVVEALELLRESLDRESQMRAENALLREQLAARPLLLAEPQLAPATGLMDRLDRWWARFIRADVGERA